MGQPQELGSLPPSPVLSLCVLPGFCGALFFSLLASACGHGEPRRPVPAVFRTSTQRLLPAASALSGPGRGETPTAAALAERSLRSRGLRFGTDGSPGALYALFRWSHELVVPARARPGDVVFFDVGAGRCGDHVGVVARVDPDGRIAFEEARDGLVRVSYADPRRPTVRRDGEGRVLNSFLRPRRPADPAGTRYFAGEMLCAVGRPRP